MTMHCPATPRSQPPSPHRCNRHHTPTQPSTGCYITAVLTQMESKGQGKEMGGSARAQDTLVAVIMDDYEI